VQQFYRETSPSVLLMIFLGYNFDNTLVKFRTGIGVMYLPYAVDRVLATAVVAETPMEVEGVHNVAVL
jgi:hypothetical protein